MNFDTRFPQHCCNRKDDKKHVSIILYRDQLTYEIAQMGYVEGDVMPADDEHDRHQVIDVIQDGNVDRVTRILDLAFAECVDILFPYTRQDVDEGFETDNWLEEEDEYKIDLWVPKGMAENTILLVKKQVHEYMVCRVMADWMATANVKNPNATQNWQAKLDAAREGIEAAMVRIGRYKVRRKLSPF